MAQRIGAKPRRKALTTPREKPRPEVARSAAPNAREEVERAYAASGYNMAEHPGYLIRRAHQRATMVFQQVMNDRDLTPTQMAALVTLMKHGSMSQNQLGRTCAMDPSTISLVIGKLLKRKLVERTSSEDDRRMLIIQLTDGQRYTLPRLTLSVEAGRRTLARLTKRQATMLISLLQCVGRDDDDG